jgi:hypothetical protein
VEKRYFSIPKKFRYEDLTSITEDKDLSFLDFFIKEAIRANLGAAIDFVKLQQEQISKLKLELINAKVAFNAKFCHLNSQQLLRPVRPLLLRASLSGRPTPRPPKHPGRQ